MEEKVYFSPRLTETYLSVDFMMVPVNGDFGKRDLVFGSRSAD